MNKEQLLDLTERLKLVARVELPIIVGSQALYAVTSQVPDSVKRSVECYFLLLAGPPAFRAVIKQSVFASSFQETNGYQADARRRGCPVATADAWIAATASLLNATFVACATFVAPMQAHFHPAELASLREERLFWRRGWDSNPR